MGNKTGIRKRQEKVKILRLQKEPGYLYFVDSQGDVSRVKAMKGRNFMRGGDKFE